MTNTREGMPLIEPTDYQKKSTVLEGLAYCVWKNSMEKSRRGETTTFAHTDDNHKCNLCNGYNLGCKDYERLNSIPHQTDPDGRRRVL